MIHRLRILRRDPTQHGDEKTTNLLLSPLRSANSAEKGCGSHHFGPGKGTFEVWITQSEIFGKLLLVFWPHFKSFKASDR